MTEKEIKLATKNMLASNSNEVPTNQQQQIVEKTKETKLVKHVVNVIKDIQLSRN
jgi:hypothetical protein